MIESILKHILTDKRCSFGKYLSPVGYTDNETGSPSEYYMTPVVTLSGKKLIIITKEIEGNWYNTVKIVNSVVDHLTSMYDIKKNEYGFILHAYFGSIQLEQFYEINPDSDDMLRKISLTDFEEQLL